MQRDLGQHTVKSFDEKLSDISNLVLEMSKLTIESISLIESAIKGDTALMDVACDHDKKVNEYDYDISNEVVAFIALRQPKAHDLRFAISAIKVSSNLERVGDYAKGVVQKISKSDVNLSQNYGEDLLKMTKIAQEMVKNAVNSFINNDLEKSQKVLQKDDEIDQIYRAFFSNFNNSKIDESSRELINVIFIAKSIERLADHASNIAAIVNYVVTGKNNQN